MDSTDHVLRIEELYLLQRVAQKINSILDLEVLLDEIVGDVANTFGYTRLAVLLKDEATEDLQLQIAAGWTGELCLKGTITFANAGHLYPLFVEPCGKAEFLETDAGMPLGIMDCEFSEREIDMGAGSRLFLYTDGVTEAINSSEDEYGADRLKVHAADPSSGVGSLLGDVSKFTAGYPASDDVTVVMLAAK